MTPRIGVRAVVAAGAILLAAATTAPAHEAHEKQAIEASGEAAATEAAAPAPASEEEARPHDHDDESSGVKAESNVPRPLAWLGRFHPPATHFPIALLTAGLLHLLERATSGAATRTSFRLALFSASALVGGTGFLGGALIYGLDHYAW
jgi:hypothetical protein